MPQNTHGRLVAVADTDAEHYLDSGQLSVLEQSFRNWIDESNRADIRLSRSRVFLIFLLIRYAGAKLNEILALHPYKDIDWSDHYILFRDTGDGEQSEPREVQIPETLSREVKDILSDPAFQKMSGGGLDVDPGFVRRKLYERAESCGFLKKLGGPEMLRKARAVELMRSSMPLPAVQMMLGHSTPNLTSSYVSFSREEIRKVARTFMEKESMRKTSARNSFFGKVEIIDRGDIQTRITIKTIDGFIITTIITNHSLERLGLSQGKLITAEVKAPSVILHGGDTASSCSAENRLKGKVTRITKGEINTECIVTVSETTEICAVVSSAENQSISLREGEEIWAMFNCFSVVLHAE